ncbi:MAG TPA: YaaR family protein [Syntrophomonadaceae bacterium]|nr:YaaR family protein [Syntrophomonadaceae bacterium]
MKIDRDKKGLSSYSPLKKTNFPEIRGGEVSSFEKELDSKKEGQKQFIMQELLGEIDDVNYKLAQSLTINDLMKYKMLVKQFLKEASDQAFLLNQQRGRSRRGRSILLTIKTIDREVEEMLENFMRKQTNSTEVLEQLDKVRGMLIDLMI